MRTLTLLICFVFIAGCSSQFAYRHLDWIIVWYSNDYLDLTHQQSKQFSNSVKNTLSWHQQIELPKYRAQLLEIRRDLQTLPLSAAQVEHHAQRLHEYWLNLRSHISHEIAPLASQLNEDQIDYLFYQLERRNQSKLEYLNEEPLSERQQDQLEEWLELFTDLFGELTSVQEDLIAEFITQRQGNEKLRVEYLQAYQAELKLVMLKNNNTQELQALLDQPDVFKSEEYVLGQRQNREAAFQLIRNLSVYLTPEQIRHLNSVIDEYIEFIDELIQD